MAVTQVELVATCGEILTLEQEEGSNRDKFAVSLLKHATVFGHVPREFLREFWHFLRHGEAITCEVTDRRKHGKATSQRWFSLFFILLDTFFARSLFIKCMHLTHGG